MKITNFILFTLLWSSFALADIKSTSGTLNFDRNNDNSPDATLNSTGFGIGITPSSNLHVQGNTIISDKVIIGSSTFSASNLQLNGSLGFSFQTVSSNTTLTDYSAVLVDTSSDNVTLTLPYAGNVSGRVIHIKKISTENVVTIYGAGNLIDLSNYVYLDEGQYLPHVMLMSDGQQWYSLSAHSSGFVETLSMGNLLLWYKFDDTSGTIATDSSNYNNYGVLTNISFSSNSITGVTGNALSFDGNDDYVEASSNVQYYGNAFTMSLWFKTTGTGDRKLISTTNGTHPLQVLNGKIRTCVGGCTAGTTDVNDGQWHFAAVVGNGSDVRVFLDGSTTPEITRGGSSSELTGNTRIGILSDSTSYDFLGGIDDVRIYNKALSVPDIINIYNEGL